MTETQTETESKSLTSESETQTSGGTKTKKMMITEKIKELYPRAQSTRVAFEDLNHDNEWLLKWLWDNQYQIIVSSQDLNLLTSTNTRISNLSGSLGRWRVVSYAQVLLEPCDLFIVTKELSDEQIFRLPTKQSIKYAEYEAS